MKTQIEKSLLKSLTLMASVIEARDAYTGGHLWRVSRYCERLAESAGLSMEMIFLSRLGGFLHDIGKIGIPDVILGKRGALNKPEYDIIKTHPGIGARLIQEHPLGKLALSAVHQHHEWVNGKGYPLQLQEDQISIVARIVCIADAFDALTSTRPYRQGVGALPAMDALKEEFGTQFDARLLDIFIQMIHSDTLRGIIGYSEWGVPMITCPSCGPVIAVARNKKDGDICCCRICGSKHRLHRDGESFVVESTGAMGTAEELKPRPETGAIETFIANAPNWINI